MRSRIFIIAFSLLSFTTAHSAYAQVGRDSALWTWTADAAHHDAIVSLTLDGGRGTGVIVHVDRNKPVKDGFEGYCLTAAHVVADDEKRRAIKIAYSNGRTASRCKVVKSNEEMDVALVWVWVPADIEPVRIAARGAKYGDRIEFAGLGGGSKIDSIRNFSARASAPTSNVKIYADVALLPGDSGGPVFNENNEVVGVISGGWFWWDGGVVNNAGIAISATWPARAANLDAFVSFVNEHQATMVANKTELESTTKKR